MTAAQAYADLMSRCREATLLESCGGLLGWDERTYLPQGAAELRGEQLGLLGRLVHRRRTDPAVGELLAAVEGSDVVRDPDGAAAANVREVRRSYDRARKVPERLVEELARVTTRAQQAWVEARQKSDFALFRPHLDDVVRLKREEAQAVGYAGGVPYDALLDEYEPGATTAEITRVFGDLRQQLAPLIAAVAVSGRRPNREVLEREYPVPTQTDFGRAAAEAVGFDFQAGRLDTTTHPFCSGIGPGDCRITTRYNPRHFSESFFGILHEVGHGLYEQGLEPAQFGTACGSPASLGIHESQSRLWENQVGRGRAFWDHFYPRAQKAFPQALGDVAAGDFYFAINDVRPSYIRVEADEATYNLHIVLRFELEQALVAGDLQVADVPGVWNEQFEKLLGLKVPDDRRGCLQDIHWAGGGIGYFPTYTLGNLYAAQLMEQARRDQGDLDANFRKGDFARLLGWLREKVHRVGHRWHAGELCRRITGRPLSPAPLIAYLRGKYAPLYGL